MSTPTSASGEQQDVGSPSVEAQDSTQDDSQDNTATPATEAADHHDGPLVVPTLQSLAHLRELSSEAICWQLSSAKPGNGIEQLLRNGYWQSDGQSHWIQVHFARRVAISNVCLYLDYAADESYTPKTVAIEAGVTHQDLQVCADVELREPNGWVIIPVESPPDPLDGLDGEDDEENEDRNRKMDYDEEHELMPYASHYNDKHSVRVHLLRISIKSMHQNGRDTHIRNVRIFGPRMPSVQDPFANMVVGHAQKDSGQPVNSDDVIHSVNATRFTTIR